MRSQLVRLGVLLCAGTLCFLSYEASWGQSIPAADDTSRVLTVTGPVSIIRSMGPNVVLEFGGQWRRRFAVVIDETDMLLSFHDVLQRYDKKTIQVSGSVVENRGRFEIHIKDLNQITVLDTNAQEIMNLPNQDQAFTPAWLTDVSSLAKDIKKLQREITELKTQLAEQQQILETIQKPQRPRIEYRSSGGNYRDLDNRICRIEAFLDLTLKSKK